MRTRYLYFVILLSVFAACNPAPESGAAEGLQPAPMKVSGDKIILPPGSPKLDHIRVAKVETAQIPEALIVAPGKIEINPNRMARVFAPLPGRVTSVKVRLGDAVQQGQPLLTIESPEAYVAMAAYRQAQSSLRESKAALAKAQADLDRLQALYEHKAAAQKDVLNAKNELAQAKAGVEQSESACEESLHRLQILGLKPDGLNQEIIVRAPIRGKILEVNTAPGEYRSDTGEPLLTVADLSSVWAASDVPESVIRQIDVGEQVEIRLTAYPGEVFRARVVRIADTVDPESRTVKVQAVLRNPNGRLRPEMFGEMRHSHGVRTLPVVPAAAVVQGDGQSWVYVEQAPGQFRKTVVTTGAAQDGMLPILSGIQAGDRVVVEGAVLLRAQ